MPIAVLLAVFFLTPWFWKLFKINPLILLLLIVFNFMLLYITFKSPKKIIKIATFVLFLLLIFYNLQKGFDKGIWTINQNQALEQNRRHSFYAASLGKIYTNKIGLLYYTKISDPLTRLQKNLFSNLEINLYFFASHPRERTDANEFEKYSFLLLPFFLIGIFYMVKKNILSLELFFLAAILISAFININYVLGPILFFPLINTVITLGFLFVIRKKML